MNAVTENMIMKHANNNFGYPIAAAPKHVRKKYKTGHVSGGTPKLLLACFVIMFVCDYVRLFAIYVHVVLFAPDGLALGRLLCAPGCSWGGS